MNRQPRPTILELFALAMLLAPLAFSASANAQAIPRFAPNDVLVRFDETPSKPAQQKDLFRRLGMSDPMPLVPPSARRSRPARGAVGAWVKYRLAGPYDPAQVADSLNRISGLTAQPNYLYRLLDAPVAKSAAPPNDPEWPNQWGPRIIGLGKVWEQVRAAAQESTIVGIIDSGVDYDHEDLASRMWRNMAEVNGLPGVDDDGNGYVDDFVGWDFTDAPDLPGRGDYLERDNDPMDELGHGTNVAGVVAAAINNLTGIAGVAPTARIMALRAGAELVFGGGFLEDDDIAAAMVYATENGAQVINMSFGDEVSTPLMLDVLRYADARGVVLIAAAGNENKPELLFPGAYDETISVAATNENDERAGFSSYGENLDLCAPGQAIVTTRMGGGTMKNNGTSFAAPHVAGAAALILSLSPYLTPHEVRSMLRAGVADLGPPGWDAETGFGRLDLPTLVRVASAPVAEILRPLRPESADSEMAWSALVQGAPPVAWSVSYGLGPTPRIWTPIGSGTLDVPSDTVRGIFDTRSLSDTSYAVRLSVTDALGRLREDRTILSVDHTPPVFVMPPVVHRRWKDADEQLLLGWTTDDLTMGSFLVWRAGSAAGEPSVEAPVEVESREHLAMLDRRVVGDGPFVVRVRAVNRAGGATESRAVGGSVEPLSISRSGFEVTAKLPPGVLMPSVADFNGDGIPEVAIKLATRAAYDTVSFYELAPTNEPELLYESPVRMRPAAAADIDGDGLLDLVGSDLLTNRRRVRIVEQEAVGLPPRSVWWTGEDILAPTLGDADGDGRIDMIALVDSNRALLRMYEASGPHRLNRVAELLSPIPGVDGRFGIWRAVGDIDGDGRPDVIAGTTGGSVVIFPNTGDNEFGDPRVIPGTGDATRVWGGIDLTGDGNANFAVLRHRDEDRFDLDRQSFRLEVYGSAATPLFTREFSDPRTDGNGFAAGPIGPHGEPALAIAMPPRLYIFTPSANATDGFTWFGETAIPSQPLIANVDGSGAPEFVVQGTDSILIMRPLSAQRKPDPPTNVSVRPYDSVSVEVTWDMNPGIGYRIWTGPDKHHLAASGLADPASPLVLGGLQTGVPVAVAVQAVDRTRRDSLGVLSEPMSAAPHTGPHVVSATLVEPTRLVAGFDRPLDLHETSSDQFILVVGPNRAPAQAMVLDRSGTRVVLSYPASAVSGANDAAVSLSFAVRDSSGAHGAGSVPVARSFERRTPGIAYALVTEANTLSLGFTTPVAPSSFTPAHTTLTPSRTVREIVRLGEDNRTFEIRFADELFGANPFVLEVSGLRSEDGRTFSAGAVVEGTPLALRPPGIVAVLQRSSTELWVVTSGPLDMTSITTRDVLVTPRVSVTDVRDGPAPGVLAVRLDENTPVGPWEHEYRLAITTRKDGAPLVLEATWIPFADRPYTGHLLAVDAVGPTELRLRFDVPIAATGQPERAIRVEPGLPVADILIADSVVTVRLSRRSRIGPWGIAYFVHVDGLLAADGTRLTELFALRLDPPATLDSVTVFPQPFLPADHAMLVFGGLPTGSQVLIYSLNGALVRSFSSTETGGVQWDGRNEGGRAVGAGVYLYVIEAPHGKKMGKIAVLR